MENRIEARIGIIDYGMGNLHSVQNALNFIGCQSFISSSISELAAADGLILPGVGAFPDAMERLNETGLDEFIRRAVEDKPLLGICLGMQLLFETGFEFTETKGLGMIQGRVERIETTRYKIPHIGWNELLPVTPSKLMSGIHAHAQVYFVHSYKAVVENRADIVATTDYDDEITAMVAKRNVYGCQFHPEKSGDVGLQILRNYRRIVDDHLAGH